MIRKLTLAAVAALFTLPALADDGIHVADAYVRVSSPMAQSGAAFMRLVNPGQSAVRLIEARSDVAQRVELHTHQQDAQGVMRMIEVVEGFEIPPQGEHLLERGGDHVMFMGLNRTLADGDSVTVTFVFSTGQEITAQIPVDLQRQPAPAMTGSSSHRH